MMPNIKLDYLPLSQTCRQTPHSFLFTLGLKVLSLVIPYVMGTQCYLSRDNDVLWPEHYDSPPPLRSRPDSAVSFTSSPYTSSYHRRLGTSA
jgi:hypothetical protein